MTRHLHHLHGRDAGVNHPSRAGMAEIMNYQVFDAGPLTGAVEGLPKLEDQRFAFEKTIARLKPEHKTLAKAGTASGSRFTDYRRTCVQVLVAVQREPGITLKELMTKVQTHYASDSTARATLPRRIEQGLVSGVRLEREGRLIRLYPAEVIGGQQ